jgi:MYXO-CTERM domain-containing protein
MNQKAFVVASLGLLAAAGMASASVYNGTGFAVPDNTPAGATGTVTVGGDTTNIGSVSVMIDWGQGHSNTVGHTWVGDVIATLTSPGGTTFALFSRSGWAGSGFGDSSALQSQYTFTDTAAVPFWQGMYTVTGGVVNAGSYRTSAALTGAVTSLNTAFGSQNSNGIWTLTLSDNASGDSGGIIGWSLNVTPAPAPGAFALLGLGGLAAARRRRA